MNRRSDLPGPADGVGAPGSADANGTGDRPVEGDPAGAEPLALTGELLDRVEAWLEGHFGEASVLRQGEGTTECVSALYPTRPTAVTVHALALPAAVEIPGYEHMLTLSLSALVLRDVPPSGRTALVELAATTTLPFGHLRVHEHVDGTLGLHARTSLVADTLERASLLSAMHWFHLSVGRLADTFADRIGTD